MCRPSTPKRCAGRRRRGKSFGKRPALWMRRIGSSCSTARKGRGQRRDGGEPMVERRRQQRMLWEGWFPEEAAGWWEPWMKHADQVLDDAELLDAVYEAQGQRRPNSRRRGRKQTSSEATLRLAVLKHVRNWSFEETEREVRANVVYRQFTRIGAEKVPDAKTMGRLVQTLGPEVVQQIHQRMVGVAQEKKVVQGRLNQAVFDPVVDHIGIHSEMLGHLRDRQLLGMLQLGCGYPMVMPDPPNHCNREGF